MSVIEEIAAERRRQIEVEGWTLGHDDKHSRGEMKLAAMAYVNIASARDYATDLPPPQYWPWSKSWWKPKTRRRDLIRAAALIVAEIERMDRASPSPCPRCDGQSIYGDGYLDDDRDEPDPAPAAALGEDSRKG